MRLDNFLFGYIKIYFDESDERKVLNRLLCENLTAKIYEGGYIEVPLLGSKKYMRSLDGLKIEKSAVIAPPSTIDTAVYTSAYESNLPSSDARRYAMALIITQATMSKASPHRLPRGKNKARQAYAPPKAEAARILK